MAWVKLDDRFFTHPKALAAGPLGCQLYIAGLAYCASHLTDGWLAEPAVRIAAAQAQVNPKVADRLVEVGFWIREEGGYRVHDYLEWNQSKEQADEERRRASERSRAAAHARWNPNGNASGIARGNAPGSGASMPRPVPSSKDSRDARSEPFAEDFDALWSEYPRKLNRKGAFGKYQATRRKGASADDLLRAVKNYAAEAHDREPRFVMHGRTFFGPDEHWRDYLEAPSEAARDRHPLELGR